MDWVLFIFQLRIVKFITYQNQTADDLSFSTFTNEKIRERLGKKGSFPSKLGSGCQDMIFPFYELPPYHEVNMDTRNLSLVLQCNLRSRALTLIFLFYQLTPRKDKQQCSAKIKEPLSFLTSPCSPTRQRYA
ncbi:hypothetical protein TNCT_735041 [Trichonephila clavata]|uniref:Uncharacterized protein n=1 Tax=Trichonephila clavata TaxID=2740835 RepID=A0A8X6KAM5_TRICU|nr:hypothetical protein TNCT_735041 [Trichonephila clavata]